SAVGSTLSANVDVSQASGNQPLVVEDGVHWVLPGTSFSSPHIAGIYAQLLSLNPALDAIDLRNLVTSTAISDTDTGATPNYDWGFGKANALAAAGLFMTGGSMFYATDNSSFDFTGIAGAQTYNVYRGLLSQKSATFYGSCFASGLTSSQFTDASNPPSG